MGNVNVVQTDGVSERTGPGGSRESVGGIANPMSPNLGSVSRVNTGTPESLKHPPGGWEMLGRDEEMLRVEEAVERATYVCILFFFFFFCFFSLAKM